MHQLYQLTETSAELSWRELSRTPGTVLTALVHPLHAVHNRSCCASFFPLSQMKLNMHTRITKKKVLSLMLFQLVSHTSGPSNLGQSAHLQSLYKDNFTCARENTQTRWGGGGG